MPYTEPEAPAEPSIHSTLKLDVTSLLVHAEALRDQAGRSPKGRNLAIVCTELQKIKAFIGYEGL